MRRHRTDWSSLVAGSVFAFVGLYAVIGGRQRFNDAIVWIWSITLLGLGIALVLRGTSWGTGRELSRQEGAGDEVGPERREDGEVEQAGGGHDG